MIVGCDLSSRSVAFVGITEHNTFIAQKMAISSKIMDRMAICRSLSATASQWLEMTHPKALFVEAPLVAGARNLQSSLKIAQICGVVLAAPGMERAYLVAVSSWKKGTVGNGNADKAAVRAWITQHHAEAAALCGDDQDLYDAAAIALYGQRLLGNVDQLHDGLLPDTLPA